MTVSPSEETVAIATGGNQLLTFSLSPTDLIKAEDSAVEHALTSFHSGPIFGLDVCVRKPLVVTCGTDKTVRIWNFVDKTLELCKVFNEEAFSVAFHPSGFHLIVGFADKVRLMNLLMEDFRTYKEIPIKACRECRFSHGGQFFAAVNSNTIQVYKTYTCEVVCNLRGHQSKVKAVCWTTDDFKLVSTGQDGATYEYDILKEGRRVSEWSQKGTNFTSIIAYTNPEAAQQSTTLFVAGSDKMLKEVQNSQLNNYLESNATLGQLALAPTARALIAGVAEPDMPGSLRCYTFPLTGDYVEYQAHAAPVSRIRIAWDELYLFSTGDDGCLCIFDIKKTGPCKRDKDSGLGYADEILVTRQFLDEKQAVLLELERKVEELDSRIAFQLRHRDGLHKEKMAEMQEKYSEEIETERRKFEVLREEKAEMEMENEEHIKTLEESHARYLQGQQESFDQKMIVEDQRYKKLEADLEREKQEWEAQHSALLTEHAGVIEQMKQDAEKIQRVNRETMDRIIKEKEMAFKHHQETLAQLEQDADREIEELKEMYEQKLAQEKDDKVRLRGQAGIHQKHHHDLNTEMMKKEEEVKTKAEESRKAEEKIQGLVKDKDSNEKEIKERDKTIADKEQRIFDLKKQNQELEKFRFVLDYKIRELKAQIDPKTADIASMKTQTQAMEDELNDYKRDLASIALQISQLQMKQRALQEEIKAQKRKLRDDLALIKRFKLDLSDCMETIAEPKALKESVTALYRKYVQGGAKRQDLDTDMQKEYNRQRDYLEKSVDSLKRKLEKDSQAHRIDNMRIMQENVSLIREINDLRREINNLKHERQAQELANMGSMQSNRADLERELDMQKEEMEAPVTFPPPDLETRVVANSRLETRHNEFPELLISASLAVLIANATLTSLGLFKVYKSGARQAWEDVPRAWQTRMNFPEFAHWMQEQAISRSRGFAVSERCLFDALDLNGIGTVTLQEFKFLDHWAHKRLKKPLPEEVQQKPPQQERSVELPVTKPPKKNTIKDFCSFLETRFGGPGGAGRAWRVAMDVKGNGALTLFEFGSGCRAVGWPHDHTEMFKLMKAAGGVKLRALDPETAEALVRFKEEAEVKSRGPLQEFWAEFMDPGGTGAISRTEFLKDMAVTLGIPKESLARVFTTLDPTDTGWVSESELQYLQTFESCLDFAEKETLLMVASGIQCAGSKEQKIQLPAGVLGDFRLPWQAVGRKTLSAEELMVSPLGRQLWAPHRSSRSFQYRALENSHMLKHRWLCSSVEDRCLFKSHDSVQTMRSDHNRLFRKKRNDFIFRTSHEFYRKGWHKYLHPEDEEEEHPS
ncbi:unnamed protein product [Effrenium voratum]|uniref:Uncharacterized protein n=1 Tax=Effrenium voratum TaxID=2562239 RepID=A0AA36J5A4_9DINO|nr:unnamed protein product [Effrenium voratum]